MDMDWNDALERAVWTAVESGLAVLIVTDWSTWEAAMVAASASMIAAIKAFARARLNER